MGLQVSWVALPAWAILGESQVASLMHLGSAGRWATDWLVWGGLICGVTVSCGSEPNWAVCHHLHANSGWFPWSLRESGHGLGSLRLMLRINPGPLPTTSHLLKQGRKATQTQGWETDLPLLVGRATDYNIKGSRIQRKPNRLESQPVSLHQGENAFSIGFL